MLFVSLAVVPTMRCRPTKSTEQSTSLPSVQDGAALLARHTNAPILVAPGAALLFVRPPTDVLLVATVPSEATLSARRLVPSDPATWIPLVGAALPMSP